MSCQSRVKSVAVVLVMLSLHGFAARVKRHVPQSEPTSALQVEASSVQEKAFRVNASVMRTPTGDEQTRFLNAHNKYRCMHGVGNLQWSDAMAQDASNFISQKTSMQHSNSYSLSPPAGPAGENLYWSSRAANPEDAVDKWYAEVNSCNGGPTGFTDGCANGVNGAVTGHFTAMVWKGATTIGCAFGDVNDGLVVCRYKAKDFLSADTPNMNKARGEYARQVFPRTKDESQCPSGTGESSGAPDPTTTTPPPSTGGSDFCVSGSGAGDCTLTSACSGQVKVKFTCASKQGWTGTFTVTMPGSWEWDLSGYCNTCSPIVSVEVQ